MSEPLRVSVVVPTYQRADDLEMCLRALAAQTRPPDEVVVVHRPDDAEADACCRSYEHRLPVRAVQVREPGQVAALNAGLDAATGSVVAFTDDDCRPAPEWVERMAAWFASDERIGAVGGRDVVHENGSLLELSADAVGRIRWFGRHVGNHHAEAPAQDVQFLKGANMAFRRNALHGFDTRLRGAGAQVCNDLQASLGVWRRGRRVVWDPMVRVEHYPAARPDGDSRDRRSREAIVAHHHNDVYVLLRELPAWNKVTALLYRLFVGTRAAPGVGHLALQIPGGRRADAWFRFRAVTAGRLSGLWTFLRSSRSDGRRAAEDASADVAERSAHGARAHG
jgi:glycosyltransferase involved in cell wall biosynthesis